MCGIWGVFNKDQTSWTVKGDKDLAELMSVVSTSRGRHSSGFCFIPKLLTHSISRPEPKIIRSVGSPFSIFHNVEASKELNACNANASGIFGHNRHATRGSIKLSNAHPFVEGDWTLVHNGTLHGGVKLSKDVEVDSHALCHKIEDVGIKEALQTIDGAFAIIAYNKAQGTVYFARNGQRPLYYYEHGNYSYVMSERLDLEYCLRKSGRYLVNKDKGETGEITEFKEHVLYQLTEEGIKDIDSVTPRVKSYWAPTTYSTPATQVAKERITSGDPKIPIIGIPPVKDLYFQVKSVAPNSAAQHKYIAETDEHERVVFYTKESKVELLGCWGLAKAKAVEQDYVKNEITYQVRFRTIEWEDEAPVADAGDVIEVCTDCADGIIDVSEATELLNRKFLCAKCTESYVKYGYGSAVATKDGILQ